MSSMHAIGSACRLLCACVFALLVSIPANATIPTITAGRLNDIRLLTPDEDAKALIIYFSDRSGWTDLDDATAGMLTDEGAVVLAVDYQRYAQALDADIGQCLYLGGELTDLAQHAQRSLGLSTYMQPILAGRDEGASLAVTALADAPANTFGGAIGLGYRNALSLRLPICPGPSVDQTDGPWRSYLISSELPAHAWIFPPGDAVEQVKQALSSFATISIHEQDIDADLTQAAAALDALITGQTAFDGLPVVPLGTDGSAGVVIFVSGDGGWRDLDKTMGEWLSGQGYRVFGVDALSYFWRQRTPQEFAADVERILNEADPTGNQPVMLVGYSFGADVLPLSWPLLSDKTRSRTGVIGLLAPGPSTSLEVTVAGWLGVQGSAQYDVRDAIDALPQDRVLCVYGVNDKTSSCPLANLPADAIIETAGGHHFDGNYIRLAQAIVARFTTVFEKDAAR